MRKLTKDSNIYEIRDKVVKIYLKRILRRFRKLNQSLLSFDEINGLTAVNECYSEVVEISVECLKEVAKRTRKWLNGDDGFMVDMWVMGWLSEPDPITHYKYFDEADRKRSRLFEALESVATSTERKKQIELSMKYFVKQFEQTADDVVEAILLLTSEENGYKYGIWHTWGDAKVCEDCRKKEGKIILLSSFRKLHWNCRCYPEPIETKNIKNTSHK